METLRIRGTKWHRLKTCFEPPVSPGWYIVTHCSGSGLQRVGTVTGLQSVKLIETLSMSTLCPDPLHSQITEEPRNVMKAHNVSIGVLKI